MPRSAVFGSAVATGNARFLLLDHVGACFAIFLLGCLFQNISLYFLIINPLLVICIIDAISQFVTNLLNLFKMSFVKKKF